MVRRVRRLRVRSRDVDGVQRASAALSDALHTASMPEAEGARFLVIKRVSLGRISPRASAPALALRIELAARAAAGRAVRFDQPGAAHADAVVFPCRTDALVALARRLARKEATQEWFWDQIAPGWKQAATRIARWRFLLANAQSVEGSVAAAAAVVHEAASAGVIDEVLTAISSRDAALWLRGMGWAPVPSARESTCPPLHVSPQTSAVLASLRVLLGDDIRVLWIGVLLAVHEQPARAGLTGLPGRVDASLRRASSSRDLETTNATSDHEASLSRHDADRQTLHPRNHTVPEALSSPSGSIASCNQEADSRQRLENPLASETWRLGAIAFSPCAGLLFISTVLARLRFGRFLARHPEMVEASLPSRLLCFIGRAAGMTDDDPMLRALTPKSSETEELVSREIVERYLRGWFMAVQRWCDRRVQIGWREVIRRPGRIFVTRTEIEVSFAPGQADIALRRIALDVDPGWVPWLGRVIRFRYIDRHE